LSKLLQLEIPADRLFDVVKNAMMNGGKVRICAGCNHCEHFTDEGEEWWLCKLMDDYVEPYDDACGAYEQSKDEE
jgi:hypothetical protein